MSSFVPSDAGVSTRVSGLGRGAWLLSVLVYFPAEITAGLAWGGRYNWLENSISDLGWTSPGWVDYPFERLWADSPLAWMFNSASILAGLLMMVGGWELRGLWSGGRSGRVSRWITLLWLVMGAFTVLTAVVPGNVSLLWHSVLAQPIFIAAPAVCVLTAMQIRPAHHHLAIVAMVLGALSLVGTLGLLIQLLVNVPFGILERMALDGVFLWMGVAACSTAPPSDAGRG